MKKFFLTFVAAFVTFSAFAQVKLSCDLPEVEFVYKRCTLSGSTAFIDFTFTNTTGKDINRLAIGCENAVAYDDEGNDYKFANQGADGTHIIKEYQIGGHSSSSWDIKVNDFMEGVTYKLRIVFTNIDEYATNFVRMKIPVFIDNNGSNKRGTLELRNVPLKQE